MDEQDARRAKTDRAFEGLYRRHRVDVYRAAMRKTRVHHEAEDITRSAFLDASRAVLGGARPELPRAWLLAIAENVRRRRFAASLRRPRTAALEEEVVPGPSAGVEAESVLAALETLPPDQRSAFLFREVVGLSYAEIAAQLEVSLPSVQMLLFRARQSLRILLGAGQRRSGVYAPAWLAWISHRWEGASAGASAVGAAGAAAVVVAGAGVGPASPEPALRPATVTPVRPALVAKHVAHAAAARAPVRLEAPVDPKAAKPSVSGRSPAKPSLSGAPSGRAVLAPVPATATAAPSVSATADPGAGPAAPPAQPTAAAAEGDGSSAPALAPAPITPDLVVQPVPVPEPITVPVPVAPPVEGTEVPALEVPTVPDVPVVVGSTPTLLPGP